MSPPFPPFFKPFLFIFFLLLLIFSAGETSARRFNTPASPSFPNIEMYDDEAKVHMKVRRMNIEVNSLLLDYNPPGANPAHEPPRRGNPKGSP